jgi:hypothetical protein
MPKPQRLRQRFDRDCGVAVFAAIAGVPYEQVCHDLPEAHEGAVSVDGWISWLEKRGFTVLRQNGCAASVVPCAHLVAVINSSEHCHWVYRDDEGDVHDPSSVFAAMPADHPTMKELSCYEYKVLTLSASKGRF